MANLIYKCDLGIGAGGVNLYERIFLGLPSIVISTSLNQSSNISNSKKKKLIIHMGNNNSFSVKKIKKQIFYLLDSENGYKKFSKNCYNSIKSNQKLYLNKLIKFKNIY